MRHAKTFFSTDHELTCLIYEGALKQALDADYGTDDGSYWVEIYDCTLDEFAAILLTAERQQEADTQCRLCAVPIVHVAKERS